MVLSCWRVAWMSLSTSNSDCLPGGSLERRSHPPTMLGMCLETGKSQAREPAWSPCLSGLRLRGRRCTSAHRQRRAQMMQSKPRHQHPLRCFRRGTRCEIRAFDPCEASSIYRRTHSSRAAQALFTATRSSAQNPRDSMLPNAVRTRRYGGRRHCGSNTALFTLNRSAAQAH